MKIWLTRPAEDSAPMAQALTEMGMESIVASVMKIVPQLFIPPATLPDALLCTSRHAALGLAALGPRWRMLPVYSVGAATTRMLRQEGFEQVITGTGMSRSLLPRILNSGHRHLLHLCGTDIRDELTKPLQSHHIRLERLVVYCASRVLHLPEPLLAALDANHIDAAVFYSPRSLQLAQQMLAEAGRSDALSGLSLYCLSRAIAAEAPLAHARIRIAEKPTHQAMMELLSQAAITAP